MVAVEIDVHTSVFDRSTLLAYHAHLSRKIGLLTEGVRRVVRVKLQGCLDGWRAEVRRRDAKRKLLDLVGSWRKRAVLGAGLKGNPTVLRLNSRVSHCPTKLTIPLL